MGLAPGGRPGEDSMSESRPSVLVTLAAVLALAPAGARAAESCITDTTVLGKTTRTCTENVGMPQKTFRDFCEAGKKDAPPSLSFKVSFTAKCPPGWAGSCAVKPPAGAIVNYWYDKREAAGAKKSCADPNPLGPGVWTDG
jgi:hypothetical protein